METQFFIVVDKHTEELILVKSIGDGLYYITDGDEYLILLYEELHDHYEYIGDSI
jgi:hypothetical protein